MNQILQLFNDWSDLVELPAGAGIVSETDPAQEVFVILQGEVELSFRDRPLGRETAGSIIGEAAMAADTSSSMTVLALTDVKLARLSSDQFYQLISSNPDFSKHALLCMSNRLRAANAFISKHFEDKQ